MLGSNLSCFIAPVVSSSKSDAWMPTSVRRVSSSRSKARPWRASARRSLIVLSDAPSEVSREGMMRGARSAYLEGGEGRGWMGEEGEGCQNERIGDR